MYLFFQVPGAVVTGRVGRRTSFEVKVNNVLVHSKLETSNFPDFDEVVSIVEEASKGEEPQKVIYIFVTSCDF